MWPSIPADPSFSHVIAPVLSSMGTYILRNSVSRIFSKATFEEYRETEKLHNDVPRAVTKDGNLLDYETLELRVHPPNIRIKIEEKGTLITLDSANRPGTLIEVWKSCFVAAAIANAMRRGSWWQTTAHHMAAQVVQCLTELGLQFTKARITSDGGWFVDGACAVLCYLFSIQAGFNCFLQGR